MIRYEVRRPFVDYGMYHEVGDIISDSSYINSLEVKLYDGTLVAVNDEGKPVEEIVQEVKPEVVVPEASEVTVTPTQQPAPAPVEPPEVKPTIQPTKPVIPNLAKPVYTPPTN